MTQFSTIRPMPLNAALSLLAQLTTAQRGTVIEIHPLPAGSQVEQYVLLNVSAYDQATREGGAGLLPIDTTTKQMSGPARSFPGSFLSAVQGQLTCYRAGVVPGVERPHVAERYLSDLATAVGALDKAHRHAIGTVTAPGAFPRYLSAVLGTAIASAALSDTNPSALQAYADAALTAAEALRAARELSALSRLVSGLTRDPSGELRVRAADAAAAVTYFEAAAATTARAARAGCGERITGPLGRLSDAASAAAGALSDAANYASLAAARYQQYTQNPAVTNWAPGNAAQVIALIGDADTPGSVAHAISRAGTAVASAGGALDALCAQWGLYHELAFGASVAVSTLAAGVAADVKGVYYLGIALGVAYPGGFGNQQFQSAVAVAAGTPGNYSEQAMISSVPDLPDIARTNWFSRANPVIPNTGGTTALDGVLVQLAAIAGQLSEDPGAPVLLVPYGALSQLNLMLSLLNQSSSNIAALTSNVQWAISNMS